MAEKSRRYQDYFDGTKLYGDDFSYEEIAEWYSDEKEGFADLGAKHIEKYQYEHHSINKYYGFKYLKDRKFSEALGFGSAYGEEFNAILQDISNLTILDPSDAFYCSRNMIGDVPVRYVKPSIEGTMEFNDNTFDLITCFGVLHHIPNVSTVIQEMHRCLKPGGYLLLREPVISMGNWEYPRAGLTKRERGIPLQIFRKYIAQNNFEVISEKRCMFSLTSRLKYLMTKPVFNSDFVVLLDRILSLAFAWNNRYHDKNAFFKIRPTNVFYVLKKK